MKRSLYCKNNAKYSRVSHGKRYLEPEEKEEELVIAIPTTLLAIRYDNHKSCRKSPICLIPQTFLLVQSNWSASTNVPNTSTRWFGLWMEGLFSRSPCVQDKYHTHSKLLLFRSHMLLWKGSHAHIFLPQQMIIPDKTRSILKSLDHFLAAGDRRVLHLLQTSCAK